jgi:hypothetical protein
MPEHYYTYHTMRNMPRLRGTKTDMGHSTDDSTGVPDTRGGQKTHAMHDDGTRRGARQWCQ